MQHNVLEHYLRFIEKVISEYYAVCQVKVGRLMQRIKNTLYVGVIVLGLTLNSANPLLAKFKLGKIHLL